MSGIGYKLKKISKMNPKVVVKKLLSFDEVFAIGFRKKEDKLLFESGHGSFTTVPLSKDFWYADPIIIKCDNKSYLFMEAFEKKTTLGRIAYSVLSDEGASIPKVVISEPFHMSFPTVFEYQGDVYMIPETSADKSLRLYKAAEFPDKWELVKRFDLGRLFVDTVITSIAENSFKILTCEVSPYGEYQCRFQKFEITSKAGGEFSIFDDEAFNSSQEYDLLSRNGGAIFEHAGKRYVAAQESSFSEYGLYMNFYPYEEASGKIATKAEHRISAKGVFLEGVKGGLGVHSYCFNEDYEVIDLKYMEYAPGKLLGRITGKH